MDIQQLAVLVVLVGVLAGTAVRSVHRAAFAVAGVALLTAVVGLPVLARGVVTELLLVTAGLMVLAGSIKRSGIASWLALKAAKAGRGHPTRILVLTGLLAWILGTLVGPVAAITLVLPVALLLAVELSVAPLAFVVVLAWTASIGGMTTLTAQPGNLWVGAGLSVDGAAWFLQMIPYTAAALATTLALGALVFAKSLRVTNERRARVLEYDEARTLGDRPLLVRTLTVAILVIVGLATTAWTGLAPSVVALGGAVVLWLTDDSRKTDKLLADIDGGTLLFFGGFAAVVGAWTATGLPAAWSGSIPSGPWDLLWLSALLGTVVDHGAVAGALVPFLQSWAGTPTLWPAVILGAGLGSGVTVLGSLPGATALGLASHGIGKPTWKQFALYGTVFGVANLAVVSLLMVALVR